MALCRIPNGEEDRNRRIKSIDAAPGKISAGVEGDPIVSGEQLLVRRKQIAQSPIVVGDATPNHLPAGSLVKELKHDGHVAGRAAK
jgi:hypothetical protein